MVEVAGSTPVGPTKLDGFKWHGVSDAPCHFYIHCLGALAHSWSVLQKYLTCEQMGIQTKKKCKPNKRKAGF